MIQSGPYCVIRALVGAVALAAFAKPAAAQDEPLKCEIDDGRPQQVARATFSMARAHDAIKNNSSPIRDLRDVISGLNKPNERIDNEAGRAYLLGQAYILLLEQPDIRPVITRSTIGFQADPTGTIDLYAAADTTWSVVEAVSPGCAAMALQWRQQKPWINVTNEAINALNANKLDSAEIYAQRSLILDRSSPYAYSILASVAKERKDFTTAAGYWEKTLELAGTDTTYNDVRQRVLYDRAVSTTVRTDAAAGAEKRTLAGQAAAAWKALLAATRDDLQGALALQNLGRMTIAAGDSANISQVYAPILASPESYGENTLMHAGLIASTNNKAADAARLFAAVSQRNPYQRDALNNLAASYIMLGEHARVTPLVDRLVKLDPSNPDNWMLYAFLYSGMLKDTKQAALTKRYTDSLVFYNSKAENMPVQLQVTEFSHTGDGTTLVGKIENRGTASKTYPLTVELLDANGQVVHTETVQVGPVAAKASQEFRIRTEKTGIAGYRYNPLT